MNYDNCSKHDVFLQNMVNLLAYLLPITASHAMHLHVDDILRSPIILREYILQLIL